MSSGLYNDNIDLTPADFYINNGSSTYIDESTQENPIHNWVIDHDTDSGTSGVTPSTPGTPDQPEVLHAVTIQVRQRYGIPSYDPDDLLAYHNAGAIFYVKYTDGTEEVCDYTDVYDPIALVSSTYVNEAAAIANAINQYFWHDDNGAHVTDVTQEDWTTAVAASFSDLSNNKPYHNLLMNSLGILLRSALNNLVSLSRSGIVFYDGLGNDIRHMLSSFGTIGATFREAGKTKAVVDSQGLKVYDNSGSISNGQETLGRQVSFFGIENNKARCKIGRLDKGYIDIGVNSNDNGFIDFYNSSTQLAHFGYDSGYTAQSTLSNAPYYTLGSRSTTDLSVGNYSVVEGYQCIAKGYASYAGGYKSEANGAYSRAEGYNCVANGNYSVALGTGIVANGVYEFACGHYNDTTDSPAWFTIGNGSPNSRSNVLKVYSTSAFLFSSSTKGYMYVNGSVVHGSDRRLKNHVANLDYDACEFIRSLKPIRYKWKNEDGEHYGFYAQDVANADPHNTKVVVEGDYDKSLGFKPLHLDYTSLISPLVAYTQHLEFKLNKQNEVITSLNKHIKSVEQENKNLAERLSKIEAALGL